MLCPTCGSERADDKTACPKCGDQPDAVTIAPPSSRSGGDIDHGAFTPGTVLVARYRVVGLLGRGGMGEVYRADDLALGQPVALKFLRDDPDSHSNVVTRLRDETRTARQVSHPNVCRVHDVGEWNGRPFVSMEYVDGEDLASLLRRIGRLPADKAVEIVRQVCAGLAAAHDRGVVHRDLKPANVMLDSRGKVRITDFGLASFADDDRGGEVAGTPAYMAPEQVSGGPVSPQTDIYAVGLLLFELVTGTAAHQGATIAERRSNRLESAPPLSASVRASVDPQIVSVIERCLEVEPGRRPASALSIAAALPGGDPLAAALAAGETPSPHAVAHAADTERFSAGRAIVMFAAFVAGVVTLLAFNGKNAYSRYVAMRYSPEVLSARAEDVRRHLGYTDTAADTARGFVTRAEYFAWRRAQAPDPRRWERLHSIRPQAVLFWHRTSPRPMRSPISTRFGIEQVTLAAVSPEPIRALDPGTSPGEGSYVELDLDGALSALVVAARGDAALSPTPQSVDWTTLFAEARLDSTTFSSTEQLPYIPVPADTRAAWVGPAPDGSGVQLRIEAAALAGRPVYFRIVAPWTTQRVVATTLPVATTLFVLLFFVLVVIGGVLARHNLQQGRTDQRGALRVAATVGSVMFAAQMLEAHHVAGGEELFVIIGALSWSLFVAAFSWLSYVALEPYVRKHWPHALIAWTRVIAGRWRDARVGRDLMIGASLGLVSSSIDRIALTLTMARASDSVVWRVDVDALSSAGAMIAVFLRTVAIASAFPIDLLFLLLLLRVFMPRTWLAPAAAVGVLAGLNAYAITDPAVQVPLLIGAATIPVLVLVRYGLLAGCAEMFVELMLNHALVSLDTSPFFARTMVLGLLLLALPAMLGLYGSLSGSSLLRRRLEERHFA
jgi:serine/threonine-protein kinase